MKSSLLFFLSFFFVHNIFAQGLDAKAQASFQSFPLGTLVTGEVGYSAEIWRKEGDFTYGYVRPFVQLDTAAIINRPYVGLEIYPISILGLSMGQGFSQRNTSSFTDFDCQQVVCDKTLRSEYVQVHGMLGYGKAFLDLKGRQEWFKEAGGTQPFYDEMSYLVGAAGADELKSLTSVLGYSVSDQLNLGVMGIFSRFEQSKNENSALYALANYKDGPWRYSVGLGQYRSSHQVSNMSAILRVEWIGLPSLALFE